MLNNQEQSYVEIQGINKKLQEHDKRMELLEKNLIANTEATKTIAENTQGLITLATELEAGTKFLCRLALAVRFVLKDIIEPFWKPVLIVIVVFYYITNDSRFLALMGAVVPIMGL